MKFQSFRPYCTGYYPDDSPMEGGKVDSRGNPLCTLQRHIAGDDPYCSVAMDDTILPWGTLISMPEFDQKYGKQLIFKLCDTGGAFQATGLSRMDICVQDVTASYDNFINSKHWAVGMLLK